MPLDPKITIALFTPSRGLVDVKWWYHYTMTMRSWIPPMASFQIVSADRRSILDAFNTAAKGCVEAGIKYLAIIEDDVFPPPTAIERLMMQLQQHPDHGIATGVYFRKRDELPDPLGRAMCRHHLKMILYTQFIQRLETGLYPGFIALASYKYCYLFRHNNLLRKFNL